MDLILLVIIIGFLILCIMLYVFFKTTIHLLHRQQAPIIDVENVTFEEGELVNGKPSTVCKARPKTFNSTMSPQVFLVAELYKEEDSPYYFSEPIHQFYSGKNGMEMKVTIKEEIKIDNDEKKEEKIQLFLLFNDPYGNLYVNPVQKDDDPSNTYTLKTPTKMYPYGTTSYKEMEDMFKRLQSAKNSS